MLNSLSPADKFFLFLGLVVSGFVIEIAVSQLHHFIHKKHYKKYNYSFSRYLFLLILPFTTMVYYMSQVGLELVKIFVVFSFLGTFFEWLLGLSFHMVVGHRLWTYHKYNINTYTSLLSIPLWGFCGVVFWLLVNALT